MTRAIYECRVCGRVSSDPEERAGFCWANSHGAPERREYVAVDDFTGLVEAAVALLDRDYPADVFKGESIDSGAQFVHKLREALSHVHRP